MHIPLNQSDFKTVTKNLKKELLQEGFNLELSHGATLNLLSRSFGYADYNTYLALNKEVEVSQESDDKYLWLIKNILIEDGMKKQDTKECLEFVKNAKLPFFAKAFYSWIKDIPADYNSKNTFFNSIIEIMYFNYINPHFEAVFGQPAIYEMSKKKNDIDYYEIKYNRIEEGGLDFLRSLNNPSELKSERFINVIHKITNIPIQYIEESLELSERIYDGKIVINKEITPLLSLIQQFHKALHEEKNEDHLQFYMNSFKDGENLYDLKNNTQMINFLNNNTLELIDTENGKKFTFEIFYFFKKYDDRDLIECNVSTIADFLLEQN